MIMTKKFGHKIDKFELQCELDYEMALCRTFRFMQLLCENNNIDMKKFLLKQHNEDGSDKLLVINFVQEACILMRQFFKIMSIKIVNIPPSILNFVS
jgi:inositol 1,4,5-triphosphate receptor type 1/inositol 1,4,5-triphosphate receptor type 3